MIEQSIVHLPELVKDIDRPVSNYLVHLSSPSNLSALRLATLVSELTFMGALPASTCRFRAVALALVELLSICRLGPATLPTSLVMAFTLLVCPSWKRAPTPVPARAVVASPTVRASITARPTTNTVALPTHITLEKILLVICPTPFSRKGWRSPGLVITPPPFGSLATCSVLKSKP